MTDPAPPGPPEGPQAGSALVPPPIAAVLAVGIAGLGILVTVRALGASATSQSAPEGDPTVFHTILYYVGSFISLGLGAATFWFLSIRKRP